MTGDSKYLLFITSSCNFIDLTSNDYFRQFGSLTMFHHLKNLVVI